MVVIHTGDEFSEVVMVGSAPGANPTRVSWEDKLLSGFRAKPQSFLALFPFRSLSIVAIA